MTRQFTGDEQSHIFYDMGAGSTVAALVSFKSVKLKGDKQNGTEIKVQAIGYDDQLGGNEVDKRLQQYLAQQFQQKIGDKRKIDIFKSQRAMAKLLREANRVKHILSANTEIVASVESLIDDLDFKTPVTRQKLEELIQDLIDRSHEPITSVLTQTNTSIVSVILIITYSYNNIVSG